MIRLLAALFVMAWPVALHAQDFSGNWQGSHGNQPVVLKVEKSQRGFEGQLYNLGPESSGRTRNGNPVSVIRANGRTISFTLDRSAEKFGGVMTEDGKSIRGNWQGAGAAVPLVLERAAASLVIDPSPHKVQFVAVDKDVRLEVLDWGGSGRALVLIPGLGDTAHIFDDFAPKLAAHYHVIGITRRGLGELSWPEATDANYNSDRLADDVLAVIASLKLEKPVLVGHSLGGEVLSSIGSRALEKISGLIYLDGTFSYSWYDPKGDSTDVDYALLMRDLKALPAAGPVRGPQLAAEIRKTWPEFDRDMGVFLKEMEGTPDTPVPLDSDMARVENAVTMGERRYTALHGPVLAIIAAPPACQPDCATPHATAMAAAVKAQADAFEKGNPSAKVVRLAYAGHAIFRTNEADVLKEMNAFLPELPAQ